MNPNFRLNIFLPFLFILVGGIEAIWGLGQLYGVVLSYHSQFLLTGSFYNPGPYSGFLATIFPIAFCEWLRRRKESKYNKRGNFLAGRGYILNRVDIEERPAIVDLKKRFGDLEIDTVIGSNHKGALVTINDRLNSKVWIRKLSGKDATPLALKTIEALQPIKDLIHTITVDNGKEFAKHQEIDKELEISFYFCKSGITDEFVSWVENKLNNRPRKRLGYLTPNEKFNSILTN